MHPTNYPQKIRTLDDLLACHGQQFVVVAYNTLLGRLPDPQGMDYYLARLNAGIPKIHILAQLRSSKEGRARPVNLKGLDKAITRYQRGRYPLIGWLFRLLNGTESTHPTERKLRGIENQVILMNERLDKRFEHLERSLTTLQRNSSLQAQSAGEHEGIKPLNPLPTTSAELPYVNPEGLELLSPTARDIFFQLKEAITQHNQESA